MQYHLHPSRILSRQLWLTYVKLSVFLSQYMYFKEISIVDNTASDLTYKEWGGGIVAMINQRLGQWALYMSTICIWIENLDSDSLYNTVSLISYWPHMFSVVMPMVR